jgi:hypothetical protein
MATGIQMRSWSSTVKRTVAPGNSMSASCTATLVNTRRCTGGCTGSSAAADGSTALMELESTRSPPTAERAERSGVAARRPRAASPQHTSARTQSVRHEIHVRRRGCTARPLPCTHAPSHARVRTRPLAHSYAHGHTFTRTHAHLCSRLCADAESFAHFHTLALASPNNPPHSLALDCLAASAGYARM